MMLRPLEVYLEDLDARLRQVETQLLGQGQEALAPALAALETPDQEDDEESIQAFETAILQQSLPRFLRACAESESPELETLGAWTKRAFEAQYEFLRLSSVENEPLDTGAWTRCLDPVSTVLKHVRDVRDNRSDFAHHQNMISEGLNALGWVTCRPGALSSSSSPKAYVESYVGGADFWGNKLRMTYKTNPNRARLEFVASFQQLLKDLMAYVSRYHEEGLVWNTAGRLKEDGAKTKTCASGSSSEIGNMNAVFSGIKSIDQSQGRTAGLNRVTKDMQTWRKEYSGGKAPAPVVSKTKPKPVTEAASIKVTKPPVCALQNGKWIIEYQAGAANAPAPPVTISDIQMNQQVYIYKCQHVSIVLSGKAKTIVMDSCVRVKLIFDSAVSSLELVNCQHVQVQCKDRVPSVAIDKTDGCLVYVSYTGKDVNIVTSKSSEMNLSFPASADPDAEYIEIPIPEQFVHTLTSNGSKLTSNVSDLYA